MGRSTAIALLVPRRATNVTLPAPLVEAARAGGELGGDG